MSAPVGSETAASNAPVRAWWQEVTIPTYPAQPPDPNPMFLEKRVYQGSSGKVYPNPFTDKVSTEKSDRTYRAVMLENEYVQLMLLPEIGGRIHIGLDKTNQYDFFYRQNVIKPALVGLLGPWISGGVEFNWPQHHRPSTYLPTHAHIEEGEDGSRTVWMGEHDPMSRMKGMVGICLYPGKSLVEAKVRLYNRTALPQTFLWWANVAVRVHDEYQAFFPPDVHFVADHAKRAVSFFPVAKNFYYGVDYREGVDISWYKNIPVPTSYMVTKSDYDFFGGYDFRKRAGFIHTSDHHIAPGKKLWTWGNADFGYAWDRNLTDDGGPYIELMAGAYTDNQPDFSWLQPYETKTFSQYWYPIQEIGPAKNANNRAALSFDVGEGSVRIGVSVTERLSLRLLLTDAGRPIYETTENIAPGKPFVTEVPRSSAGPEGLRAALFDTEGKLVIAYQPASRTEITLPGPATEPPPPSEIASNDELYLTGLHLEQYRHATRDPRAYWLEGLRRDPKDARLNNAMGLLHLRAGELATATEYFETAISRLTHLNGNPYDGESFYNLGVTLKLSGHTQTAYDAFYKCVWNYAWRAAGYYSMAAIDAGRGDLALALDHLDKSLLTSADNLKARGLKVSILRHLDNSDAAKAILAETLALDPLDLRSAAEEFLIEPDAQPAIESLISAFGDDIQSALDLTFDYVGEGLLRDAYLLLTALAEAGQWHHPIVWYLLSSLAKRLGRPSEAQRHWQTAAESPSLYCFPSRIEEMLLLEAVCAEHPEDAKAGYYLGNLYYDKRRYEEAIGCWRASVALDPGFSIPWRNLGIAEFNVNADPAAAMECYRHAFASAPRDPRVLYEWDQLKKRVNTSPRERLASLSQHLDLVALRDDLTVEYITLLNQTGEPERALHELSRRKFNPWEGGEGLVSTQYVFAHVALGRELLHRSHPTDALAHLEKARYYPKNLGEGKHLLTLERDLDYFSGRASAEAGRLEDARHFFTSGAAPLIGLSRHNYFRGLCLRELGRADEAQQAFETMLSEVQQRRTIEPQLDYFATSLPNLLLFVDDLHKRNEVDCLYLMALGEMGLGNYSAARILLDEVLRLDASHLFAPAELRELDTAVLATTYGTL